jgi:hypothetical protein
MARSTPKHIDKKARSFEYLVAFAFPFFVLRIWLPLSAVFWAALICVIYIRVTVGKPDGLMLHTGYRLGLRIRGLLPHEVGRLGR